MIRCEKMPAASGTDRARPPAANACTSASGAIATATIWAREADPADRLPGQPGAVADAPRSAAASPPGARGGQAAVLEQEAEVDQRRRRRAPAAGRRSARRCRAAAAGRCRPAARARSRSRRPSDGVAAPAWRCSRAAALVRRRRRCSTSARARLVAARAPVRGDDGGRGRWGSGPRRRQRARGSPGGRSGWLKSREARFSIWSRWACHSCQSWPPR